MPEGMRIAAVIPTRDRVDTLMWTLDGLAEQDIAPELAEVVVVDNCCTDGTAERVGARAADFPLPLQVVRESTPSASFARNTGIRAASADLVLLMGDDTRPVGSDLLRAHLESHSARPEPTFAIVGNVRWGPQINVTPFLEWLNAGAQFNFRGMSPGPVSWKDFYTAHVSLKRAELIAAGLFSERLPYNWEDLEIAGRLHDRGMELNYRDDLVMDHDHDHYLDEWLVRQTRAGTMARFLNENFRDDLLPDSSGPIWQGARVLGPLLRRLPFDSPRTPRRLREEWYRMLNAGAYAAGYRVAAPVDDPFASLPQAGRDGVGAGRG
jgi:glycosyltransferase involved in cell wall biosynthesis